MNLPVKTRVAKLAFLIACILLGGAIVLLGINYYKRIKNPLSDPLTAIPSGSELIIKISKPAELWSTDIKESLVMGLLLRDSGIRKGSEIIDRIDSILNAHSIGVNSKSGESFWISAHPGDSSGYSILFVAAPVAKGGLSGLSRLLDDYGRKSDFRGIQVIAGSSGVGDFYYSLGKGLFRGSFDIELLKKSTEHLQHGGNSDADLPVGKLFDFAGKNVDANLFMSYQWLSHVVGNASGEQGNSFSAIISDLAAFAELDMEINETDLIGAGFTLAPDSSEFSLSSFEGKGTMYIDRLMPANTISFVLFSPHDFSDWYSRWIPGSKFRIDDDPILSWLGEELAMARIEGLRNEEVPITIFRAANIEICRSKMMHLFLQSQTSASDSLNYRAYFIGKLNMPDPIAPRLGSIWALGSNPWFALIDDYAVFASNAATIQSLIDNYLAGSTLSNSEDYISFASNINRESNVLIYVDGRRLKPGTAKAINSAYQNTKHGISQTLQSGIFAMQWVWEEGKYFTNVCYRAFDAKPVIERPSGWQQELGTDIIYGPYVVGTHRDAFKRIIVIDADNNLCFFDEKGTKQWTHKLPERPYPGVHEIDVLKNGRIQYLISSRNALYLIDFNGNDVAGFPKKLKTKAAASIAVFDYESTKDYRLIYPGIDRKIHNITIEANPVQGWSPFSASDSVVTKVEHLRMNDNDILAFSDKSGKPYFIDRRGNARIVPKGKVTASSSFFVDKSQPRHKLIFTDGSGDIIILSQGGDLQRMHLDKSGAGAQFMAADLNGDGMPEYVIVNSRSASIYSGNGKPIKNVELDTEMLIAGTKAIVVGDKHFILLYSEREGRISLLGIEGLSERYQAMRGSLMPVCIDVGKGRMLLSGERKLLYSYPLN